MRKHLAVVLALVILAGVGSATALSQNELTVVKTWVGASIQTTDSLNFGLVPHIAFDIGPNIEATYSFAVMTQEEVWMLLEIDFIKGNLLKLRNPRVEVQYSIGLYGAFLSQKENEEKSINMPNVGILFGFKIPIQINNISTHIDGDIGMGFSTDLSFKMFIRFGLEVQIFKDLVFQI